MNAGTEAGIKPPETTPGSGRLISLDALRGFDMFWIVGAEELVKGLEKAAEKQGTGDHATGAIGFLATQLSHVAWEGFHFYDLIFPLFVFLAGVSIVYSLDKIVAQEGKNKAYIRVTRRLLFLYIAALAYYGGISNGLDHVRYVGVLQRIAISYFFASLLYLNLRRRGLITACAAILIGYWALLSFVPVPADPQLHAFGVDPDNNRSHGQGTNWGQGGRSFAEGNNWCNYVDFHFLPGRRWDGYWDPEGILSSIPAVGTALLGVVTGLFLKNKDIRGHRKAYTLMAAGVVTVLAGTLWGLQLPVIKKLWTSSYVLVAGGYSTLLLGFFYLVVDVWKCQKWATPFVWIGSNPLTIYLAWRFIDFDKIAEIFVGGPIKMAAGAYGDLVVAAVTLLLVILLARFLYMNRIFIRL